MADSQAPAGGVDPAVQIPDAIKAASAAADAAHKAAYPDATPPPPADGGNIKLAPDPADTSSLATPPSVTPESNVPPTPTHPSPAQTLPSADQQERQPTTSASSGQTPEEDWERRYKAMKGRHDGLLHANQQMQARLGSLEQTLATVAHPQPPAQNGVAPGATDPTLDQITPQEIADYGEEFLTVVEKQARRALLPHIQRIEQENAQLKQQLTSVGHTVTLDAKQKLEGFMDQNLENWRDLNYNEDFLGWLAQPDTYAGTTRHNLLKQAYERNDSGRVLAFFKGFLADEAATAPQPPNATNGAGNTPPKVPLEKFAAPGRARTAAPSPAEKPVITRGQISAFYAQVAAGAYAGNEAEKLRLENMIFEAQREGRIT